MTFARVIAVLVALTFCVGITQCATVCVQGDSAIRTDVPPCHDMGHGNNTSKPDHSSCQRPLLIAEQAAGVYLPAIAWQMQAVAVPHAVCALTRYEFVLNSNSVLYPPRPPRRTTVLLI